MSNLPKKVYFNTSGNSVTSHTANYELPYNSRDSIDIANKFNPHPPHTSHRITTIHS